VAEAQGLGEELGVDFDVISPEEWQKGIRHEREHADVSTDAKEIAKIALAHLKESPRYYSDLEACMPLEKEELAKRRHLNLPPGTMIEGGPTGDRRKVGKIKVKHADGTVSWIQARAGQVTSVADRNAPPILGHASHPLSSRNPRGR
jgi:hypothetical protein